MLVMSGGTQATNFLACNPLREKKSAALNIFLLTYL
jgi:hypothetical protein